MISNVTTLHRCELEPVTFLAHQATGSTAIGVLASNTSGSGPFDSFQEYSWDEASLLFLVACGCGITIPLTTSHVQRTKYNLDLIITETSVCK